MPTPSCRRQLKVPAQSALPEKPRMTVVPLAMAPSMAIRWEIDLSPGSSTLPRIRLEGLMVMFISGRERDPDYGKG